MICDDQDPMVLPSDLEIYVRKPMAMCDEGRSGMGRGSNLPTGRYFGTLICEHDI